VLKRIALIFALAAITAARAPAATAYEALNVVKAGRGDGALQHLVEVQGDGGQPQPRSWTILMSDDAARGGVREFVVAGGEIVSERTPVRGYGTTRDPAASLNFSRLNVDSDSAFRVADKQARSAKVGFNAVDYKLRTDAATGAPIWEMHLFDYMGAPVGTIEVSAESGATLHALRLDPDAREKPVAQATPKPAAKPKATPAPTPAQAETNHFKGGVFGFFERTGKKVGRTMHKTALNVAGTVQEVLTGDRTIDQDDSSDE